METNLTWNKEKLQFTAETRGHQVSMDTPENEKQIGSSPKELVLQGLAGCSAMDVISILEKMRQPVEEFTIKATTDLTDEHPKVFTNLKMIFELKGVLDVEKCKKSVEYSLTKYCGVAAMLSKVTPVQFELKLNGVTIDTGIAKF